MTDPDRISLHVPRDLASPALTAFIEAMDRVADGNNRFPDIVVIADRLYADILAEQGIAFFRYLTLIDEHDQPHQLEVIPTSEMFTREEDA